MTGQDRPLEQHTVTLTVSPDTAHLFDALATRLGVTFDQVILLLSMYGAYLLAAADQGLLPGLDVASLTPERLRSVYVPWLRQFDTEAKREVPHV